MRLGLGEEAYCRIPCAVDVHSTTLLYCSSPSAGIVLCMDLYVLVVGVDAILLVLAMKKGCRSFTQ